MYALTPVSGAALQVASAPLACTDTVRSFKRAGLDAINMSDAAVVFATSVTS
ncbi:MAG: hypothetical protein ACRENP_01665 [Longimicrobiales bacterium]